jgi:DNA-binding NarL/FixJ family response regulator
MANVASRVLVVDDERFFREAICDALAEASIECVTAETGEAALERLREPDIGVVVLDISLPGISGIEVLQRLTAERPSLRVIILSAHTEQELVLEALRLGACDYLAKPLHDEELVLAVRRARASFGLQSDWETLRGRLAALESHLDGFSAQAAGANGVAALEQRAARAVADVLGAAKTSLMLVDPSGDLRVVATHGRDLDPAEMDPVPPGHGVAGVALVDDAALLIDDVSSDPRFRGRNDGRYQSESLAVAPLRGAHGPLGVLCATDRDGGVFSEEDLALLRILSTGLVPALAQANAATGHDAAPGNGNGAAEADFDDAELARRICDVLTSEVEPERLIGEAMRVVAEVIPAAPVSLYLLDPSGTELRLEGQCEGAGHADREVLPVGRGLTGIVCHNGRLVATDSPEHDPRFDVEVDTNASDVAAPLLCVPVVLRNKTLGVMRAFPIDGASASSRTGEILSAAISAAVRNVLMYRSVLESVDEVAKARREMHSRTRSL